jgi:8-oxo-dGTP pyrophosphatase MutT (NUDIX family)
MLEGKIRVLALAIIRRVGDGAILATRHTDEVRGIVFYRPLGGGIEFGESSADAVHREIQEELGLLVHPVRLLGVLENCFVHQGKPGHEILFNWLVEPDDPAGFALDELVYTEGQQQGVAQWVVPAELARQGIPLYPRGLTELLAESGL